MSDTPRTDAKRSGSNHFMGDWVNGNFAAQLERELNAANERIKRLEEAGDRLAAFTPPSADRIAQWNKAKEDKP